MRVKDPTCGMELDQQDASGEATYQGQTYYFCCLACQRKFEHDPEAYLHATEANEHRTTGA